MKKIINFFVFLTLSVSAILAQDITVGNWGFSSDGSGGYRAWGTSDKGAIVVPSTVTYLGTTYNVTGVRNDFADKCVNNYPGADITSVQLPEGINFIGNNAFSIYFSKVTTFNLPSTVTTIDGTPFTSLSVLTSIYCNMTNPPTVTSRMFTGTTLANVTLHIPAGTSSAYAAAGWVGFASVVEASSATVPDAPTSVSATIGNTQSTVSFTVPSNNGGATITGYTVTSNPGSFTASGASSPITVTGLTNGTAYTFTVVATNSVGNSSASDASNSVTPAVVTTVPGAPTALSVTAGNAQATVSFTAPASNGGATITGYTITSNPGSITASGAASPIIVTGLTNGTAYTFTAVATNSVGNSVASAASNSVTPSQVNLAAGKVISGYPSSEITNITDGSMTTKYNVSPPTLPDLPYYILDLGSAQLISYAIMGSGYTSDGTTTDSAIKGMKLQSSNTNNGSDWTDIPGAVVTNNPITNVQAKVHFPAISTRYVKWVLTEMNNSVESLYKPAEIMLYAPTSIGSSNSTSSLTLTTTSDLFVTNGAELTIDNAINIATLTIGAGAKVSNTNSLTATSLTINSDAVNGTGTYLQTGTSTISTAYVKQYLATTRNWYVSSPVAGAVAPTGFTYYQRDEAAASWTSQPFVAGNTFVQGKGYIALPGAVTSTLTFSGQLNMANVTVPLTWSGASSKGYNLIGNPYPSHLTCTKAFVDNVDIAALIEPSIYYRTNTGSVNTGGDAAWSFKTYNSSTDEFSPAGTTNIIPPMQAFWVKAKAAGNLVLNSSLTRSHQTANPLKAPAVKNTDRQRLRLQVNSGLSTDEALIYFDANASNAYDRFDSPKMFNGTSSNIPDMFTMIDDQQLVINGMNVIPAEIPLHFKANASTGQFSLKATEMTNFEVGTLIYVKNNKSGMQQLISDGTAYSFETTEVDVDAAFSIIIKSPGATTDIENTNSSSVTVFANTEGKITVICNLLNKNDKLIVYNSVGQRLMSQSLTNTNTVLSKTFSSGVYVVKVNDIIRKVIIK